MDKEERFFISSDNSGHNYLIPLDRRVQWLKFLDIPEEDERSWDVPDWARRLEGEMLTFSNPIVMAD